jgi:hypothetical protein
MITRRQVLFGLTATGVVAATTFVTGFRDRSVGATTIADWVFTMVYRGRTVKVIVSQDRAVATIDDRTMLHLERSAKIGTYHTHLLPFRDYPDIRSAMVDIIDKSAQTLFVL